MEILYRKGVHCNEPTGILVGNDLLEKPVAGVHVLTANEIAGDSRFGDCDMDLTTREPSPVQMDEGSHAHEARLATEQWRICNQYPATIAPHNAPGYAYSPSYACIGRRTHPSILKVISFFDIRTVILNDFAFTEECPFGVCIETYNPPPTDADFDTFIHDQTIFWRQKLTALTNYESLADLPPARDLSFFEFSKAFSSTEAQQLQLTDFTVNTPFQPMPAELSKRLDTTEELFAMNWNGRNASHGAIFGAVVVRASDYAYDPVKPD